MGMADCNICSAVAAGGRIRITEDDADLLEEILAERRKSTLIKRRTLIDEGDTAGLVGLANLTLRQIDRLSEEILRTRIERGWHTSHEPERPHS